MNGKGKTQGNGRAGARVPLTLAAALLAVALVFTVSYAYARYATEYEVAAPVAYFGATSSITYTDAWDNAQAFDGDLGTMKPKDESGVRTIDFTLTVYNGSDVPIYCVLTLGGDYEFTFGGDETSYALSEDNKTLTTGILGAGMTGSLSFTVKVGDYKGSAGTDVYSGTLDITVTYIQASEETTP